MKTHKFLHTAAVDIANGKKTATWRLYDDKDLSVNDEFNIIDKVNPKDKQTWAIIGRGKIYKIVEKKLGDITSADMDGHEGFSSPEQMLKTYKNYYGQRVSFDDPIKMIYFNFQTVSDEIAGPEMLLDEAKVFTDGGSRGNPGHSACAFVILDNQNHLIEKTGFYIGIATNNQAEYNGFQRGLERAQELGIDNIELFSDSQLVVNQMKGVYKVKNQELASIHQAVSKLASSFRKINFNHIPREKNKLADQEVNRILDDRENGIM
jgi:ribonuclease HI